MSSLKPSRERFGETDWTRWQASVDPRNQEVARALDRAQKS
jgi:hypothetical protein